VKRPHGLFLDAEVIPAVDFSRLDEVAVVIEGAPRAQGVAAGGPAPGSGP